MGRILLTLLAPLLLTGCLLTPGNFDSELRLMKDGSFAFRYDGEIQMLALSKLADLANKSDASFSAECFDEDFDERPCTDAETAEQRAEWEEEAEERRAKQEREAEGMRALLGGLDPSNPEAAEELAARLQRQRGWNSVEYRGDGLFDVEFALAGRLDHDFEFPTVERMPSANAFVALYLREERQVRVDAPGFAAQQDGNPMLGGANLAAMAAMSKSGGGEELPKIVSPEGRFAIVTDGAILANNTDEGPRDHPLGQSLEWAVTARTTQPPTALIAFD